MDFSDQLNIGHVRVFNATRTCAMSNSNHVLGATRNSEKGTVLLIVNLQYSNFLQFGNLAIWSHVGEWNHNPNRHVLFLEKFEQTKIGDL